MGLRQAVTKKLVGWLPAEDQARMAEDVVAWLSWSMPAERRSALVEQLCPKLLQRLRTGQFGLRLAVYYHLLRLQRLCRRRGRASAMPRWPGRIAPEEGFRGAGSGRARAG